jgi:phytoene/squalene synthetase
MTTAADNEANAVSQDELIARGWASLPAAYRIPDVAPTLDEARAYCRRLAESHYENFHVVSRFLPKVLRPHFHAIYAYCRIPKEPFADLLTAFRQDQTATRYETMQDVLGYCRYSANPVGRLVLYACGEVSEENFRLSDATCTALQLANFWQDVRVDWGKDRVYLPQEDMRRFGVSDETIARGVATAEFRALLRHEVAFARSLFEEGLPLIGRVNRELAVDLDLFSRGGLAILDAIERQDCDVLRARPALSKRTKLALAMRAIGGKALPFLRLNIRPTGKAA